MLSLSTQSPFSFCSWPMELLFFRWLAFWWKYFVFLSPHCSQFSLALCFQIFSSKSSRLSNSYLIFASTSTETAGLSWANLSYPSLSRFAVWDSKLFSAPLCQMLWHFLPLAHCSANRITITILNYLPTFCFSHPNLFKSTKTFSFFLLSVVGILSRISILSGTWSEWEEERLLTLEKGNIVLHWMSDRALSNFSIMLVSCVLPLDHVYALPAKPRSLRPDSFDVAWLKAWTWLMLPSFPLHFSFMSAISFKVPCAKPRLGSHIY